MPQDSTESADSLADTVHTKPADNLKIGWLLWIGMAVLGGALTGALFGAFDAVYHGPHLFPADVLVAIAMAAAIGAVLFLPVAIITRAVFAVMRIPVSCPGATGALAATGVVTLVAAVVLLGTHGTETWQAFVAITVAAALSVPIAGFVGGRKCARCPLRALSWMVVGLSVVLVAACGFAYCRRLGVGSVSGLVVVGMCIVGFWFLARVIPHRPKTVLVSAAIAVIAMGAGFTKAHYRFSEPQLSRSEGGAQPPNVVFIVLDTTRRDHMGAYGGPRGLTPVFDRLAAEGVVYENAFSASPWTMPSHASMFTGLHPVTHGCSYEHHAWLDDEFETLAEILSRSGYQTWSLLSNFYLGRSNLMQGFDRVAFTDRTYETLALHDCSRILGAPAVWVDQGAGETARSLDQWFADEFDPDQPLFLFVNLFEAHEPYIPPFAHRREHLPANVGFWESTELSLTFDPFAAHARGLRDEHIRSIVAGLYDAEIAYQDEQLGRLLTVLKNHINLEQTLLIVTADHGENLGIAGRWEHLFAINDDLIHVPMVIRYPERFKPGARIDGLCQTVDIFGTVLDVAGATAIDATDDAAAAAPPPPRSLAPDRFEAQDFVYAQVSPFPMVMGAIERNRGFREGLRGFTDHKRVISDGRNKLILSSEGEHRLYDVVSDPLELIDRSKEDPEELDWLMNRLNEWRKAQPPYVLKDYSGAIDPLDDAMSGKLRDIGYVK